MIEIIYQTDLEEQYEKIIIIFLMLSSIMDKFMELKDYQFWWDILERKFYQFKILRKFYLLSQRWKY